MLNRNRWKAAAALLMTFGMNVTTITPMLVAPLAAPAPAVAQTISFPDVPANHWASDYIRALVSQNILAGFPDGTFRPDAPVTRAEFSAMLRKVYQRGSIRSAINFVDVPSSHWAYDAIRRAYEMGFVSGYPDGIFLPEQNIPREQVLVALANGLNYQAAAPTEQVLGNFADSGAISNFARGPIAAATEKRMVVNYPNVSYLNPGRNATRAEVAAFLYQALTSEGRVAALSSPYIANAQTVATNYRIAAGTSLPVSYMKEKILLMPDETLPVTFNVRNNITTTTGQVLIPAGSQVKGNLRPAGDKATQFVAQEIVMPDGSTRSLKATSSVITTTETVRKGADLGRLLKNTAIGTAAAAAISAVTGDRAIATEELLIGAGGGALLSLIERFLGRNSIDVLVVQPETNLNLTLTDDFVVAAR
ncbi:S-layer homology domain-containing protein [Limnothrix sp. FACHB-708]|uniref:S-layer homology domain-containing protein n=1 Tax=unclassified Limnothrix TaxID=2632864 RepID=UPI001688D5F6|nr:MULTISPECIES: S-layer homology domain-containing protein [unclassified Limnothrix]MBD2553325.1 S-layer homology domain-containing protein [Limnothrix sp. FACHB-708]MBD2590651.1 S-layer homology domain-containing protein [Limnothrix sp. FACHB-406]